MRLDKGLLLNLQATSKLEADFMTKDCQRTDVGSETRVESAFTSALLDERQELMYRPATLLDRSA